MKNTGIDGKPKKMYTLVGGLACQKEAVNNMTSYMVKGALCNDRGIWAVRARVYDPKTGKYRQRTKSTGFKVKDGTKRKAERAMREIVAKWELEANAKPVLTDPTFAEYVQKWLDKKSLSLAKNTMQFYHWEADTYILPELGEIKIRDMTLQDLQIYYKKRLDTLSVRTIKKIHVVISGALMDATRDGVISVNFAKYVEFPRGESYEGKAYKPEQVSALLDAVAQEGEPIRAAVTLAVCYGLRRSEVCGLRWEDIDFDEMQMRVCNTVTEGYGLILDTEHTKTKKSRRTIDLIEVTVPYFLELKSKQKRAGIPLDKVCIWPDGRTVKPSYITHRASRIMKKYGLEHIRLHDLRRTAATLLATKASLKQVQNFLGHEDITTTGNIYVGLLEKQRRDTSGIMDDILRNLPACSASCSGKTETD